MNLKQTDCFKNNKLFWKFLGIYPGDDIHCNYKYYTTFFILLLVVLYDVLLSINFYYIPRQLDDFIQAAIFYFTELAVLAKLLPFIVCRSEIMKILTTLDSDIFQPNTVEGLNIIDGAKKFNVRYWNIIATVSITSNLANDLAPLVLSIFFPLELELPISSYSFLSEEVIHTFFYPLFLYQGIGMATHMLYNVNIDTFILGVMILVIAQLDILDLKLRHVTNDKGTDVNGDKKLMAEFNEVVIHYREVAKYCRLIQDAFSFALFVQFSMASCIICVCLFRFTTPAPFHYYVFLTTYMCIMILQIMVPCWFGTKIMDKSCLLAHAIYSSDWTSRSKRFKSSLRILAERLKRPITIVGGKMFTLSLETFVSILNSAYSFFTLLRHMQTREA